ncbi:hypothetical protein NDU88_000945 [Pleurodeles waltl]|uniref:Uncharacterized protein n=1 Tax=Pleurodeles waltl TaxID=8319 RepID=A0AAV7LYA7_PLEWA|nr:hypothetical protein NDU88_000945 [Pleurodeles waltl]
MPDVWSCCRLPKPVPVLRPLDRETDMEVGPQGSKKLAPAKGSWSRVLRLSSLPVIAGDAGHRTPGTAAGVRARARSLTGARP